MCDCRFRPSFLPPPLSRLRLPLLFLLGSGLYLWLVDVFRIQLILPSPHDDGLFLRHASSLVAGEWLGPFDNLALTKGLGYPAFLALTYTLGLPLLLAQHLLYLASVAALCIALRTLITARWALTILFFALLFNPAAWSLQRVIRDHFYMSMTLLVLAGAVGLFAHRRDGLSTLATWAAGLGGSLAILWHTRQEGVWILPALLVLLSFACVDVWRRCHADRWWRLSLFATPAILLLVSGLGVAAVNHRWYGVFVTTEFSDRPFLDGYGAISRVIHLQWQRFIPMPAETRARLYQVSPSFAELRPYLEGPGRGWMAHPRRCDHPSCGRDYFGGWFVWAFRDAVSYAGHYRSAPAARAYYRRLAGEVNRVCDSGALPCLPRRSSLVPPLHAAHLWPLVESVGRIAASVISFDVPAALEASGYRSRCEHQRTIYRGGRLVDRPGPSLPVRGDIYPCAEGNDGTLIHGWAYSLDSEISFEARAKHDGTASTRVSAETAASPDVAAHAAEIGRYSPGAERARFSVTVSSDAHPVLVLKDRQGTLATIDLESGRIAGRAERLVAHIDWIATNTVTNAQSVTPLSFRLRTLALITTIYQKTVGWLALGAVLALAALLWRAPSAADALALRVVALATLAMIAARIMLVALIDATAIPLNHLNYRAPAHSLLIVFSVISLYAFIRRHRTDAR